jgi:hypothetical protein
MIGILNSIAQIMAYYAYAASANNMSICNFNNCGERNNLMICMRACQLAPFEDLNAISYGGSSSCNLYFHKCMEQAVLIFGLPEVKKIYNDEKKNLN